MRNLVWAAEDEYQYAPRCEQVAEQRRIQRLHDCPAIDYIRDLTKEERGAWATQYGTYFGFYMVFLRHEGRYAVGMHGPRWAA